MRTATPSCSSASPRLPSPALKRLCTAPGLLLVAALAGAACGDGDAPRAWGQAQSHLAAFDGQPLLSANWDGRMRPYVFDGETVVPLVAEGVAGADLDLLAPQPVSDTEILMPGTRAGERTHDLYLYDKAAGSLTNLTRSPARDDGRACVEPGGRLVAYRHGREQVIARLGSALEPRAHPPLPALHACIFLDAKTLVAVEKGSETYRLHVCRMGPDEIECDATPALDDVQHFVRFSRAGPRLVVIARLQGQQHRRAWFLTPDFTALEPAAVETTDAEVLDYDGTAVRYGKESRYWSSLAPGFDGIVYRTLRLGDADFAIVATAERGRHLARREGDAWVPVAQPDDPAREEPPEIREFWLPAPSGERYQAFWFGPEDATQVVVWWHGGPHENVSPRFNPYFAALQREGFAVMAVNYPGSTGRGADFERSYAMGPLEDTVAAVWNALAQRPVVTLVSWSVSSGLALQEIILARGYPVSAVVDQSGWGRSRVPELAERRGVPAFILRGTYDLDAPVSRIDHAYPDGHDIRDRVDFESAMDAVADFLGGLPPAGAAAAQRP